MSQLWTSYRDSPAVAESGSVGRLPRAGDRAPYGHFAAGPNAGTSVVELLRGTDHHLLLFEGRRADAAGLAAFHELIGELLAGYPAPIRLHAISAAERGLH